VGGGSTCPHGMFCRSANSKAKGREQAGERVQTKDERAGQGTRDGGLQTPSFVLNFLTVLTLTARGIVRPGW